MSQTQIGGKLLGQGVYGCVFNSTLHCKKKRDEPDKSPIIPLVSKLTGADDAMYEVNASKILKEYPFWKNYFGVTDSDCEPSKKQAEKDLNQCKDFENKPMFEKQMSDLRVLFMPNYGTTLGNVRIHLPTFDTMRFVSHLIEAGALLALKRVVHRDLHSGNILVDQHNVPRIIDFGLLIIVNGQTTQDDLKHKHNIKLEQEPPDATIVNAIALDMGYDGMAVIDTLLRKKAILKKIQSLLNISEASMRNSLYRFYQQSKSVKGGDLAMWFKVYWRLHDSWGIGVNIVELLMKLAIWPTFSMDAYRAKLFPILRKMCAVNPAERIDCIQALYQLNPNHFIIKRADTQEYLNKVGMDVYGA